jgi:hypothetical protein
LPRAVFLENVGAAAARSVLGEAAGALLAVVKKQVAAEDDEPVDAAVDAAARAAEERMPLLARLDLAALRGVLERAVAAVQPRAAAQEDAVAQLREALGTVLRRDNEWAEAAKILAGIPLDSGQRWVAPCLVPR